MYRSNCYIPCGGVGVYSSSPSASLLAYVADFDMPTTLCVSMADATAHDATRAVMEVTTTLWPCGWVEHRELAKSTYSGINFTGK